MTTQLRSHLLMAVLCMTSIWSSAPVRAQEAQGSAARVPFATKTFPDRKAFVDSALVSVNPSCIDLFFPISFPGFSAEVPFEFPVDDVVCDERGTLSRRSASRTGAVEVVTLPDRKPLIDHIRFFGGLALVGDCPESAPRWSGCFPLPELGPRAPVNLPPGAFFDPLPASQDRMTVDRFLNMCRLHELIMPEPQAGNPQSLVNGRFELLQLGLQTTVGPDAASLQQQAIPLGTCLPGGALELALSELLNLGLSRSDARKVIEKSGAPEQVPAEEVVEDLIRACDGKTDGDTCSPETVAGSSFGMQGLCSTSMASLDACSRGDADCGSRRVCLPGLSLGVGAQCGPDRSSAECTSIQAIHDLGAAPGLAEVLVSANKPSNRELLELLRGLEPEVRDQLLTAFQREFSAGCTDANQGDECVALRSTGECSSSFSDGKLWCRPLELLFRAGTEEVIARSIEAGAVRCRPPGQDMNGDGVCDACEEAIGFNASGRLISRQGIAGFLELDRLGDQNLILALDLAARHAIDDSPNEAIERKERQVRIFNNGRVVEDECQTVSKCLIDIPSTVRIYGHIHTKTPSQRFTTEANDKPSKQDFNHFRKDKLSPRRDSYVRGTFGRITVISERPYSCLGKSTSTIEKIVVRTKGEPRP